MSASTEQGEMHYSMVLEWDARDEIYVVTVPELAGCQTHGRTLEEAVKQGRDAIESWLHVARQLGTSVPPPRHFTSDPSDVWIEHEELTAVR